MMLWNLSDIRVLSLWQPWASLCVHWDPGHERMAKEHETRHWCTLNPGGVRPPVYIPLPFTVAIHATMKDDTLAICRNLDDFHMRLWDLIRRTLPNGAHRKIPRGAIIGVANVVQFRDCNQPIDFLEGDEFFAGDFSMGRWAWRLADVRRLVSPIPLKGKQQVLWPLYEAREQWDAFLDAQLIDPRQPGAGRVGSLNEMRL